MNTSTLKLFGTITLSLILSIGYLHLPQSIFTTDNQLRDLLFQWRGELPKKKSQEIVIVDIDEKSIQSLGQWPWSRDVISELLLKLTELRAGIIGLDIVFPKPDRSSPHLISKYYPDINTSKLPNFDKILAQTLSTTPVVGGYIFRFDNIGTVDEPPILPAVFIQRGENKRLLAPTSMTLNTPLLQNSLYSSGFFNNLPDEKGMVRSVPLIMSYDSMIFGSLAFEMVRIYSGANSVEVINQEDNKLLLKLDKMEIPIDAHGRFNINFRGPRGHYRYISVVDVLENRIEQNTFENKFVLVGTSALGLYDARSTTFDPNIPGVEIHANTIDNLLTEDYLVPAKYGQLVDIAIIWATVLFTMLLLHFVSSSLMPIVAIGILGGLSYLFYFLLFEHHTLLNLLFPLIGYIMAVILSTMIDYHIAHKQRQRTKDILGKKVSVGVMNHLLKQDGQSLIAPKEVEASIFFSDVQGFTTISEKLGSPTRLIQMLNSYMTPMVDNIIMRQGTIDKFIGDAIMAYWNAPLPVEEHADKAVGSAIDQIMLLEKVNRKIQEEFHLTIKIGIGVHTGLVTAGDMGSEGRSDYTVIGDSVNLASRLEGLTRYYDADILISENTYTMLTPNITRLNRMRYIDTVQVKGKSKPIKIYEVITNAKSVMRLELERYTEAIECFQKRELSQALSHFEWLEKNYPGKLYAYYLQRCESFIINPDKEFTTVRIMTSK